MTSDTPYTSEDDVVDVLPEDLDPQAFAGAYKFPDNSRRRIPAAMYVVLGVGAIVGSVADLSSVNGGVLAAGIGLLAFGAFGVYSGRKMSVDERAALIASQQAIGFPVGHASAQHRVGPRIWPQRLCCGAKRMGTASAAMFARTQFESNHC